MTTNLLAQVVLSLITNVTNATFEMPLDGGAAMQTRATQRVITTNVLERSTITWTLNGRTNSCSVDRMIYSATQVLRLKETWEAGSLTIHRGE